MNKLISMIVSSLTTVIVFVLSAGIVLLVTIARSVVWPILRLCAKAAMKGVRKLLVKARVVKSAKKTAVALPTPDCFKDSTNVGKAQQFRL